MYFKGLFLSAYDFSDPLLLILNCADVAYINIVYEYDRYNRNYTTTIPLMILLIEKKRHQMNLTGNQINILKQDPCHQNLGVLNSDSEDLKRVYLRGGEGIMMEIDLFDDGTGNDILGEIKSNGWFTNEANLTMYIDKEAIDMSEYLRAIRLFLYDIESKAPVVDYFIDQSQGQKPKDQKEVHSGLIEIDEDKKGIKYKIAIAEHVKNIIRNDSSKKLALVVTSDITNAVNTELKNIDELEYIPISSVINPLGTIL